MSERNASREVFDGNQKVEFTKPSARRKHCVVVQRTFFWVNLDDIFVASPFLFERISGFQDNSGSYNFGKLDNIAPFDFLCLLESISLSENGQMPVMNGERIGTLLHLAIFFKIPSLLQSCSDFIYSDGLLTIPIECQLHLFDIISSLGIDEQPALNRNGLPVISRKMRAHILRSLMMSEDYTLVVAKVFLGKSASVPLLKTIFRHKEQLYHRMKITENLSTCGCKKIFGRRLYERGPNVGRQTQACSVCNKHLCSSCSSAICAHAVDLLLRAIIDGKPSPSSTRSCSPDSGLSSTHSSCSSISPFSRSPPN